MRHALFFPAKALMLRLRFSTKFFLVGTVLAVVLLFLGWRSVSELRERLGQLSSEVAGARIAADLVAWNKILIDHRRLAVVTPPAEVAATLHSHAALVDAQMRQLEADAASVLDSFDSRESIKGLREGWTHLDADLTALPVDGEFVAKAFALHAKEFDRLYSALTDIGDLSGATLETDMDLFYEGYPTFNAAPKLAGITVRMQAYQTRNLLRGTLTMQDRLFYELTEARLKDAIGAVKNMYDRASDANPAVKSPLQDPLATYSAASASFLKFTHTQFIDAEHLAVNQAEVDAAAQAAVDAGWALVEKGRAVFLGQVIERTATVRARLVTLVAIIAAAILLAAWLFVGMYLGIATSVAQLAAGSRRMSGGDFRTRVDTGGADELQDVAETFNAMAEALGGVFGGLKSTSARVLDASIRMHEAANRVSAGSETQAGSAQAVAATVEELSVSQTLVADHAREAVDSSVRASAVASKGSAKVTEAVVEIRRAAESVELTSTELRTLGTEAGRIGSIVSTIGQIAGQTNLLALNAAIEAARAGETGRGFAVVADEVRKLAENTRTATVDISGKVDDLLHGLEASIAKIAHSRDLVIGSVAFADGLAGTLQEIDRATRDNLGLIESIAHATSEQSAASGQIAGKVEQIARSAEESSAAARQTTDATELLRRLSEELADAAGKFEYQA